MSRADLYKQARELQQKNLFMRKFYAVCMVGFALLGIVSWWLNDNAVPLLGVPFFLALLIVNERMIRRMRRAGF